MTRPKDFGLLYKFNYPPYQIINYSDNSVVVCGGGGKVKSGVPNKIDILELSEVLGSDILALPTLKNRLSYDTGDKAIMSIRRHLNYLLTAEDASVCEYIMSDIRIDDIDEIDNTRDIDISDPSFVIRERGQRSTSTSTQPTTKVDELIIKPHRRVERCFSIKLPNRHDHQLQNNENTLDILFDEVSVVRYCDRGTVTGGQIVVTGCSTKGAFRVFQRYNAERPMELVLQLEINIGNAAVRDMDISPNGSELVTICEHPEGRYAHVWSLAQGSTTGTKVTELALTGTKSRPGVIQAQYKFRHCRYARTHNQCSSSSRSGVPLLPFVLYTTHQPVQHCTGNRGRATRSLPSYISVWGPLDPAAGTDYQLVDVLSLGNNYSSDTGFCSKLTRVLPSFSSVGKLVPTALAVSACGFLSAVGSGEGQVDVYRLDDCSYRLSRIYRMGGAHSFFVTDLAFMCASRALRTDNKFELLSIGVDGMLRYHRDAYMPTWLPFQLLQRILGALIFLFFCDRFLLILLGSRIF